MSKIQEAIKRYLIAAQSNPSPFYHCPVCKLPAPGNGKSPEGQRHFSDCPLGKALALLEAEERAEPTEFTKAVREWIELLDDIIKPDAVKKRFLEACDKIEESNRITELQQNTIVKQQADINRLTAENKRLGQEENQKLLRNAETLDALDSGIKRIQELTAENANLTQDLQGACDMMTANSKTIAAQAERIEKLEGTNKLLRVAIAKQAESYSVSLPKEMLPPGPVPEDPLVLAARQLMLCFPEKIPEGQEQVNFNIPAYIVEELRQALKAEKLE